ncbi:hypothetical protein NIM87_16100 [Devosia sp. XJ19-1]|uniref:Uncharacterized protein n=1 Tax=Devosia ureilytica TaxID=2952754 RepID=A0A9Q4FU17_9HYPH|nr:hypothetical protein [Devosia ureilytica]MCP8885031.1 hypothetical protein [Devosia ureilytica]MCP8888458.1 hypothetical protein [Devosia ureilytica]
MTNTANSGSDRKPGKHDPTELRKRLKVLLGDDALAYVDLDLPNQPARDEAREKHNARTAHYKQTQALQLAPDSEAVRIAASNVLLTLVRDKGDAAAILRALSIRELLEAGYDEAEGHIAFQRLMDELEDLRAAWYLRTRQKLSRAVVKQLRELNQ